MIPTSTYLDLKTNLEISTGGKLTLLKDTNNIPSIMYVYEPEGAFVKCIGDPDYISNGYDTHEQDLWPGLVVDYFRKLYNASNISILEDQTAAGLCDSCTYNRISTYVTEHTSCYVDYFRVLKKFYIGAYEASTIIFDHCGVDITSLVSMPNQEPEVNLTFNTFRNIILDKNDASTMSWELSSTPENVYTITSDSGSFDTSETMINVNYFHDISGHRKTPYGWHMITNWEWATLIAHATKHPEYLDTYGADLSSLSYQNSTFKGLMVLDKTNGIDNLFICSPDNIVDNYNYTGTGPLYWNWGKKLNAPSDLIGNIWEFVDGFVVVDSVKGKAEMGDPGDSWDDFWCPTIQMPRFTQTGMSNGDSKIFGFPDDVLFRGYGYFFNAFLDYTSTEQMYDTTVECISGTTVPYCRHPYRSQYTNNSTTVYPTYSDTLYGWYLDDSIIGTDETRYSILQIDSTNYDQDIKSRWPRWNDLVDEDPILDLVYETAITENDYTSGIYLNSHLKYVLTWSGLGTNLTYTKYASLPARTYTYQNGLFFGGFAAGGPEYDTVEKYALIRGGSYNLNNNVEDSSVNGEFTYHVTNPAANFPDFNNDGTVDSADILNYGTRGISTIGFSRIDLDPTSEDYSSTRTHYGAIGTRLAYWDINDTFLVCMIPDCTCA